MNLCPVQAAQDDRLELKGLRNPLLPDGSALAADLGADGLLLTGQNGVGKSTLLRSIGIGIGMVLHRAFGSACADFARMPCRFVMSSMRIDDSLSLGDSSHMAQAKRLLDMLVQASRAQGDLLLIDEVFSATNHIESIAAAVPTLARLSGQAIVLVSTHNLILAPLLKGRLRAMRLEDTGDGGRALSEGILRDANGIDVLAKLGFDTQLVEQSRALAARLEAMMRRPEAEL